MGKIYGLILAIIFLLAPCAVAEDFCCNDYITPFPKTFDSMYGWFHDLGTTVNEHNDCWLIKLYTSSTDYLNKYSGRSAKITIARGKNSKFLIDYRIMAAQAKKEKGSLAWETISGKKVLVFLYEDHAEIFFSPREDFLVLLEVHPKTSKEEMRRLSKLLPLAKLEELKPTCEVKERAKKIVEELFKDQ